MSAKGTDSSTQWLLACGPIGAFGFILVFLIAGAIRPNYSPMYHHVSSLSLGDGGWVQISNFVVTGALMAACALGLRRSLASGPGATWGPLLIVAFGLGLIGAGVFVADAAFGYPPGAPAGVPTSHTFHGTLHNVVSIVVFASVTAACFVFGPLPETAGQPRLGPLLLLDRCCRSGVHHRLFSRLVQRRTCGSFPATERRVRLGVGGALGDANDGGIAETAGGSRHVSGYWIPRHLTETW